MCLNIQSSVVASRLISLSSVIFTQHTLDSGQSPVSRDGLHRPGSGPEQFRPVCGPDTSGGDHLSVTLSFDECVDDSGLYQYQIGIHFL